MARVVVVFDFDKTIIDCDSDNWVVDESGATELFNQLLPSMPWNSLMDRTMRELHSQGKTIVDITASLKRAPLHSQIITAIKSAHSLGNSFKSFTFFHKFYFWCDLRIVSDANLFFIETILKHHGLIDYFSEINTNPSLVDEDGKLRIFPYHDFTCAPHGCDLCPPNMCKGIIMERIRSSILKEGKKQFIYLGDGNGDYCPSRQLGDEDYVMPRKNCPLWELIFTNSLVIKAEVHEWSNGEELERVLLYLIKTVVIEDDTTSAQLICKFQTIPMSSHDALPHALPVPH